MRIVYTQRWSASITDDVIEEATDVWTRALAGVTPEQVACGVKKIEAATDGWPPTPGQFRAMCLPTAEDLGLPDRETAWKQVTGNAKITHAVVWHVRELLGSWDLKNMPAAATRPKFDREWAFAVGQAAAGQRFEWPRGTDPARGIEDTRGKPGRRGPTAASDLALKAVRDRMNLAPAPATPADPQPAAQPKDSSAAVVALDEVRDRLSLPPIKADPALHAVSVEPATLRPQPDRAPNPCGIGETELAEHMEAWNRAPDAAKGAAASDAMADEGAETPQDKSGGAGQGHPTGAPQNAPQTTAGQAQEA